VTLPGPTTSTADGLLRVVGAALGAPLVTWVVEQLSRDDTR
jgi:hypothetical protein